MRRYPEYKESGVEFIGEIPKDWNAVPLTKYLESIIDYRGRTPEKTEDGRFLVTAKNIRDGKIDYEISQEFTSEDEYQRIMTRGIPQIGDVLFTTEAPLGEVANVDDVSIALAQRIIKFRPKLDFLYPYFLKYWILSYSFQSDLQRYATGSTAQGIKASKLHLLKLNLPPLKEQTQIANFLDHKTEQIDELIRIKERRIQLLQEQRTALINQTVTKGLDPNVEMKPSGVEWIGEIPKDWIISKVKHEFESLDNLRIPLNAETRGGMKLKTYDYYGASGVIDKVENYIFDEPLILIGEDGANLYLRSTPLAFKAIGKYWVNNHAHVLKPKNGNIDYLTNMLESLDYTHYITGAAQPKLTSENLMNITVIIPPPLEQIQIANFLDYKTKQIDELIAAEQRKVELLKEYRQSLISEAVTGKIDVRNEV